jgi:hypothetical protein
VGASASAAQEVAQTGEEARGVETNAGAAVRARGLGLRLANTGAGARRALVACEAWHGSALARAWKQVRRWRAAREQTRREREQVMRSWRAETRVSRAQERELERSTVEAARRLGSGAGRNKCWSGQWRHGRNGCAGAERTSDDRSWVGANGSGMS